MDCHKLWWRTVAIVPLAILGACGGGSNGSNAPPSGGDHVLTAVGGEGTNGAGGHGGAFYAYSEGGDIQVLESGTVNTDVALPTQTPYLGTHPVNITADTTLSVGTTGLHLVAGETTVYDGTDVVTGIHVARGVTLTIAPNFPGLGTPRTYAYFNLDDGFVVEGTVKLAKVDATAEGDGLGTSTAGFRPEYLGSLWIASTGKIDLSGDASTSGAGANGGAFYSHADVFHNAGTVTTAGGAGASGGGAGGSFELYTGNGFAVSTGAILTSGGPGGTGSGGAAGNVNFETYDYGYFVVKGSLSAIGGDGDTGGGRGGNLYFYTDYGDMVLSGTFDTHGGDARVDGTGGDGGYFYPDVYGNVRIAGDVDTHGGKGAGATGNGGAGGYFQIYTYSDYAEGPGEDEPDSWGMFVGANFTLDGGSGAAGGAGGYVYLEADDSYPATLVHPSPIQLVGYQGIDLSGGDGTTDGGNAGAEYSAPGGNYNYLYASYAYDDSSNYVSGSIVNEVDWVMKGGAGGSGAGGAGAGLDAETYWEIYPPYTQMVKNSGKLDGSGGAGATTGGDAGYFYLYGDFGLENTGTITASGGAGGTGAGGASSSIYLYTRGPLTCSGALTANGGSSAAPAGSSSGDGAAGGNVYVSTSNTVSGGCTITATGGSSGDGVGGNGGYVWVLGQDAASRVGAIGVFAGTGETGTPVNGEAWVDGQQIAGP